MTNTKTCRADALKTGMRIAVGFSGASERVTRVHFSSAGIHTLVTLEDGSERSYRNHDIVEIT
jgi:hypothetical protein